MLYRLYVHVIYTKNAFGAEMKRNAGFTLIELVIVIIVLGILAATAVPKFVNLQDDAKEAAMKGVESALHSAANVVYAKSAIDGIESSTSGSITTSGGDVDVAFGYPDGTADGILAAVELSGFSSKTADNAHTSGATLTFWNGKASTGTDTCVSYVEAAKTYGYQVISEKCSVRLN